MKQKPEKELPGHFILRDVSQKQSGNDEKPNGKTNYAAAVMPAHDEKKHRGGSVLKKIFSGFAKTVQFLASIAGVALMVYGLFQLKTFVSKVQTIMELQGVINNLKASAPIIQMQLVSADTENGGFLKGETLKPNGKKTFKVGYFNASGEIENFEPDTITIAGNDIYVDCDVYNFTYSLIKSGEAQNIAIPYRIYSDTVAPENGIILNPYTKQGIPYSLLQTTELGDENFYKLQNERLQKLLSIINDPEKAEQLGIIRTRQKAAVANYSSMKIGSSYKVLVQNNGGLTLMQGK